VISYMRADDAAKAYDRGQEVWVLDSGTSPALMSDAWARVCRGFGFAIVAGFSADAVSGESWWIERPRIDCGDLGPFATRELALTVRSYVEASPQGRTYPIAARDALARNPKGGEL
jgi:hypothetical protein